MDFLATFRAYDSKLASLEPWLSTLAEYNYWRNWTTISISRIRPAHETVAQEAAQLRHSFRTAHIPIPEWLQTEHERAESFLALLSARAFLLREGEVNGVLLFARTAQRGVK